jgi:hypothetical protein
MRGGFRANDGTAFRVPGLLGVVTQGSASAAQPWAGMISTPLGSGRGWLSRWAGMTLPPLGSGRGAEG